MFEKFNDFEPIREGLIQRFLKRLGDRNLANRYEKISAKIIDYRKQLDRLDSSSIEAVNIAYDIAGNLEKLADIKREMSKNADNLSGPELVEYVKSLIEISF